MQVLSQRDPRWKDIQLGTSPFTLGTHGCTLTGLAMILGTTPDVVNSKLNQVGGFKDGSLVIWAKVAEAFPGTQVKRVGTYDNADVAANLPTLVEVDFDGTDRTDDRHWVVYVGGQKLADPWTGTVEMTSKYPVRGYAVIKPQVQKADPLQEQLQHQIDATNQCQNQLKTALDQASNYQKQVDSYISQVNEYKILAEEYRKKYEAEQRTVIDLKAEISKIHSEDKDYGQEALDAQHLVTEKTKSLHEIADKMDIEYDPSDDKKLVEDVLSKVAQQQKELQFATTPQLTQFQEILKMLVSMGINNYLSIKGQTPIDLDNVDDQVHEKVRTYLTDLTNELLATPTTASAPVTETIKQPRESILSALIRPLINLLFTTK